LGEAGVPDGGQPNNPLVDSGTDSGLTPGSSASGSVGPEGGTIQLSGGVIIQVPEGAVAESVEITLTTDDGTASEITPPTGVEPVGEAIVLEPGDIEFLVPVTVTLPRPAGANVVLWAPSTSAGTWSIVDGVTLLDDEVIFETTSFGVFVLGTQQAPDSTALVPQLCTYVGVLEPGAADSAQADFLCDENGASLHDLAARFPDQYDIAALAQELGRGIVDLNIDAMAPNFGIAYAWVDDVFIGRFPRENPLWDCQGCGLPCQDWTTLVLEPGSHTLRVETYDSGLCTQYFNQGNIVCGNDFDPLASLTGLYNGNFSVELGTCSSESVIPEVVDGVPAGEPTHIDYSITCAADVWGGPDGPRLNIPVDRTFDLNLLTGFYSDGTGVNVEVERYDSIITDQPVLFIRWFHGEDSGLPSEFGGTGRYEVTLTLDYYDGPGTYEAPLAYVSGAGSTARPTHTLRIDMDDSAWGADTSNAYFPTAYQYQGPNLDTNNVFLVDSLPSLGYDPDQIVATVVLEVDDGMTISGSFDFDGYGSTHSWDDETRMNVHTCQGTGNFTLNLPEIGVE
jgi:hypothetical protein